MKRFKITLLVPHSTEIVVASVQEAHNEATRLVEADVQSGPAAVVHSIEEIGDIQTDPIPFGDLEIEFTPE
jgi:hypothetical protein